MRLARALFSIVLIALGGFLLAGCQGTFSGNVSGTISTNVPGTAATTTGSTPLSVTAAPPLSTLVVQMPSSVPNANETGLTPNGPSATREGLTIQVMGTCANGPLTLSGSGFTPNGQYLTTAQYPGGREYTYLLNGGKGTASESGTTPDWRWNCLIGVGGKPDPAGTYTLKMFDETTLHWVQTTFVVSY